MHRIIWLAALTVFFAGGCSKHKSSEQIVLYTSIDEPIARPIVDDFQKQTGLSVLLLTDTEATKSNSLANKLEAEKDHPRADVFWANEIFNSINLANQGILAPYDSPAAATIPARYKDPDHRWTGQALRVRVMVLGEFPKDRAHPAVRGLEDLADPFWKDQIAMALPTSGTTGGQMAALQVIWGKQKAESWWRALHANGIHLLGGNSDVASQVGSGALWLGLTDNDDADNTRADGGKLQMILPDQDSTGTLMLPATVSLVSGAPHPGEAKKLIDYLLSPAVEKRLIDAHFAYTGVRSPSAGVKAMDVDYRQVAAVVRDASRSAAMILQGRE